MFDIGFLELLLVAVVGLLVLGPERLPRVVKQVASFTARSRQFVGTIREEFEREANLSEMRETLTQQKAKFEQEVRVAQQELKSISPESGSSVGEKQKGVVEGNLQGTEQIENDKNEAGQKGTVK